MLKRGMIFLKEKKIIRFVGMLMFALFCFCLTGCKEQPKEADNGPEKAQQVEYEMLKCWMCPFFEKGYEVAEAMEGKVARPIAKSAIPLLWTGYVLWLGIFVLKQVSSLKEVEAKAFWKGFTSQTFLVLLGYWLLIDLANGGDVSVLESLLKPIFSGFVDASLLIIKGTGGEFSCTPGNALRGMMCLVEALQSKLNISTGFAWANLILMVIPGIGMFLAMPSILVLVGTIFVSIYMMIHFPLILLDYVARYSLLVMMSPLFVVSYCFKVTRQFASQGMVILVQIGFGIIGFCVFIAVLVGLIEQYIDTFLPYVKNPGVFFNDPKGTENIIHGPGLIGLIFVFIFLILFSEVITDVMQAFSGGPGGLGTAKQALQSTHQIAKQGANFAKNTGKRIQNNKDRKTREKLKDKDPKKMSAKERKDLIKANERLEKRGFLKKDEKSGKLEETDAYKDMGKSGVRHFLKNRSEDLHG